MAQSKYSKYIVTDVLNKSIHPQIIVPSLQFNGETCGANFCYRWSYLNEPFQMIKEPHEHDFDQILGFVGGNPQNIGDFRAEVEFWIDGEKQVITTIAFIRVPKGVPHGPLNFKRIDLPIMFLDMPLAPAYTRVGDPEGKTIP